MGFASVYIPAVFKVTWRGIAPGTTVAAISAIPYYSSFPANSRRVYHWNLPTDDPEACRFLPTTAALPAYGGVTMAWNSGVATATITYATIRVEYLLDLRGPRL